MSENNNNNHDPKCKGKWKTIEHFEKFGGYGGLVLKGKIYVQKCNKCGYIRHKEISI